MMKELFKQLNKRPVAYYAPYAQISGSVKSGVLLSQIMYWYTAMDESEFYKTESEWLKELAMKREEFRNAKKSLEDKGFISSEVRGNERRTYYFPEIDNIIEAINSIVVKHDNGKSQKTTLQSRETVQCTYTENTTETTTKSVARFAPINFKDWFEKEIGSIPYGLDAQKRSFIEYWTETSPGAKKAKWQKQVSFDIKLRWNRWIRKSVEWEAARERERQEKFIKKNEQERYKRTGSGEAMPIGQLLKERF